MEGKGRAAEWQRNANSFVRKQLNSRMLRYPPGNVAGALREQSAHPSRAVCLGREGSGCGASFEVAGRSGGISKHAPILLRFPLSAAHMAA